MLDEACAQLTDVQRASLRLVGKGLTSKEIARETGLTYQTVDQYLSRAALLIGAQNRREAARLFAQWRSSAELNSSRQTLQIRRLPPFWTRQPNQRDGLRRKVQSRSCVTARRVHPHLLRALDGPLPFLRWEEKRMV